LTFEGSKGTPVVIRPDEIRRKAENLYCDFLKAWLAGVNFPLAQFPLEGRPAMNPLRRPVKRSSGFATNPKNVVGLATALNGKRSTLGDLDATGFPPGHSLTIQKTSCNLLARTALSNYSGV
jgi:hypothetical protein